MNYTEDPLQRALMLLGGILDARHSTPVELVVCGGAALRAIGLVSRATKDVDVLARRGEIDREVMSAWPLPDFLLEAVAEVAGELRLPLNWLNASAGIMTMALENLPASVWSELVEYEYGSRLRIGFVGRKGLLFLKAHAAVDREEKRDLFDLKAIDPTTAEWQEVMAWLEKRCLVNDGNRARLYEVMSALKVEGGHE